MDIVNIHDAKTNLSKLVDQAAKGKPFIIAKSGIPWVKVVALDTPTGDQIKRIGFMEGQFQIPDDFNEMCSSEINEMFYGEK